MPEAVPALHLTIATPEEMAELGARLAAQLRAGDLVTLNGELGAGKTTLTRDLGEALGVRGAVTSPTFVLARTHPREDGSGAPLVHVDAYRLSTAAELDDLDIDFAGSIVVVEWGAGLLDGITDTWLSLDIVRPTGARVIAGNDAEPGDAELGDDEPGDAEPSDVDDLVEPREITITGHGDRWKDLGWVGAASN
ncbi:MAG: tRNA (adenosine(37)-N6)-threonylcarbamoyltransferase complex ATPase subunit type 1 TsaE [Glaciihabitans sp.]